MYIMPEKIAGRYGMYLLIGLDGDHTVDDLRQCGCVNTGASTDIQYDIKPTKCFGMIRSNDWMRRLFGHLTGKQPTRTRFAQGSCTERAEGELNNHSRAIGIAELLSQTPHERRRYLAPCLLDLRNR
jgi:hypothetical protein